MTQNRLVPRLQAGNSLGSTGMWGKDSKFKFNATDFSGYGNYAANAQMPSMNQSSGGFGGMTNNQTWGGFDGTGATVGGDKPKPKREGGGKGASIAGGIAGGVGMASGLIGGLLGPDKGAPDEYGIASPGKNRVGKGALSGVAQGVQMGASFGPWGMLAGAVIGVATGAIMGNVKAKKEDTTYLNDKMFAGATMKKNMLKLGKVGMKMKTRNVMDRFNQREKVIPLFKNGGSINVIASGKLHKEKNSLGEGDKGIPVVDTEGKKLFELEKEELILNLEATKEFEELVKAYKAKEDKSILVSLGKRLSEEIMKNTKDNSERYGLEVANEA